MDSFDDAIEAAPNILEEQTVDDGGVIDTCIDFVSVFIHKLWSIEMHI